MSIYDMLAMQIPSPTHCPPAGYIRSDVSTYRSAFSFAFVRNPWDRAVSAFEYLKQKPIGEDDTRWAKKNLAGLTTFEEFADALRDRWFRGTVVMWRHFLPQHFFLTDRWGRRAISYVGRFETLQADMAKIGERVGIVPVWSKSNATQRRHYSEYYSEQARNLIGRLYRVDIQSFGYTFDLREDRYRDTSKIKG
jgi:hypothetical protein